jgi:hypothetical protein
MTPTRTFAVSSDVLFRELAGEAVLLNLKSGVYYGLDPVGTRVWALLTERRTLDEVCTALLTEYDVDAETLGRDVTALVSTLCDKGLVVPEATAGA